MKPTQLRLAISFLCCFMLSCKAGSQTAQSGDADTQAKVKKLVAKTLKQMAFVEGGKFMLGDPGVAMVGLPVTRETDNKPAVPVTLDGYSLMKYKVTYEDFDVFVAANGLPKHPPEGNAIWQQVWQGSRTAGDVPAGVNWQQAKDYCLWLGKVSNLPFDLPTEAQWEFAARNRASLSGINTPKEKFKTVTGRYLTEPPYPTDSGFIEEGRNVPTFEWGEAMIKGGALYPIGKFPPSPLGIYDMTSNGLDWTNSWYSANYADAENQINPKGASMGTEKVLRGGLSAGGGGWFEFTHIHRSHEKPTEAVFHDNPLFYVEQNARCALNQTNALPMTTP